MGFSKENPYRKGMPNSNFYLNSQIRQYFSQKYGVDLSETEADLCLESLADLFLAFADREKTDSAVLLKKPDEIVFPSKTLPPSGALDFNSLKL